MVGRWIRYLLALLGAVCLRVAYTGWLAGMILAVVCALPLLGLLTALPAVLSSRVELAAVCERLSRGENAFWRVEIRGPLNLALGRTRVTVESVNVLHTLTYKKRQRFFCTGAGEALRVPAPADRCGLVEGRVAHAWAQDALGLFWLPVRRGAGAKIWVTPQPPAAEPPALPEEERPSLRRRPGGGPGEDYDTREYRPGDPVSSIHWKLSAKRDAPIVRETLEAEKPMPVLALDCFGPPDRVDAVLDALLGMSDALLAQGRPHAVEWIDQSDGKPRRFVISGKDAQTACLDALLSCPAPLTGRSVLDEPLSEKFFYLQPGGEET